MLTEMHTTLAVVTAPISIVLALFGGVLWAVALQQLGADVLTNPAWGVVVFPLWFLTVCAWGLLLRALPGAGAGGEQTRPHRTQRGGRRG